MTVKEMTFDQQVQFLEKHDPDFAHGVNLFLAANYTSSELDELCGKVEARCEAIEIDHPAGEGMVEIVFRGSTIQIDDQGGK